MNTSLIDGKLDRCVHLKITHKKGVFDLLRLYNGRLETYYLKETNTTNLQIYIPGAAMENGRLSALKSRKDLLNLGSFYTIVEDISKYYNFNIIVKILNIPSVLTMDSYLIGNDAHFVFKYHSNFGKQISEAISGALEDDQSVFIEEIRSLGTYKNEIMRINNSVPLIALQSSFIIPEENGALFEVALKYPDTVTEVEPRSITVYGLRAISYGSQPIAVEGMTPISEGTFVYETKQLESVMMKRRQELNRRRIPRISTILELRSNRIFNTTIIPEASAKVQLATYLKTDFQAKKLEPKLEFYSRMNEDTWNYL